MADLTAEEVERGIAALGRVPYHNEELSRREYNALRRALRVPPVSGTGRIKMEDAIKDIDRDRVTPAPIGGP